MLPAPTVAALHPARRRQAAAEVLLVRVQTWRVRGTTQGRRSLRSHARGSGRCPRAADLRAHLSDLLYTLRRSAHGPPVLLQVLYRTGQPQIGALPTGATGPSEPDGSAPPTTTRCGTRQSSGTHRSRPSAARVASPRLSSPAPSTSAPSVRMTADGSCSTEACRSLYPTRILPTLAGTTQPLGSRRSGSSESPGSRRLGPSRAAAAFAADSRSSRRTTPVPPDTAPSVALDGSASRGTEPGRSRPTLPM